MSIDKISIGLPQMRPIEGIKPLEQPAKTEGAKGAGFSDMLSEAIKEVDTMQKQADQHIEGLVTGKGGVTPHDAMIALEKADVAFQLMNQIRSKIIRAYEEVIRTQV